MTRRDFVPALLSALASLVAAIHWRLFDGRGPHRPAFHALGAAYLAARGPAARPHEFLERVARQALHTGQPAGHLLARQRTADFASGKTVILGGWIVAESEGLFCAGISRPAPTRG